MARYVKKEKGHKRKLILMGIFVNAAFAFMIVAIGLLVVDGLLNEKRIETLVSGGYSVIVPENTSHFSVTHDNKVYSYVENGKLIVKFTTGNQTITEITESNPVIFATSMEDRNIIVYFTYGDEGNKTTSKSTNYGKDGDLIKNLGKDTVTIHSYDTDRKTSTSQHKFSVKDLIKIDSVEFSSLTNMIYINAKVGTSDATATNTIYEANITDRVYQIKSDIKIKKIANINTDVGVYYQTEKNNIYFNNSKITPVKSEAKGYNLIGSDDTDNVYLQSIMTPTLIYKIKDKKVVGKIDIVDTAFVATRSTNNGVFLVYGDRVVNIAKPAKEEIMFYEGTKYLDVFTNRLYMVSEQRQVSFRSVQ
ncbi:MAG: hypothetical protein RR306_03635 [Clostridia bacterium]